MKENSDRDVKSEGSYEITADNNSEYLKEENVKKIKQLESEYKENSKRFSGFLD